MSTQSIYAFNFIETVPEFVLETVICSVTLMAVFRLEVLCD